jgi:uncharacterized protein YcbK (DUF882 family)
LGKAVNHTPDSEWINGQGRLKIMGDLTKNFNRAEFACHDGCGFDDINMKVVEALQALRDKLGKPIFVVSGCRCPAHNAAVGGAGGSQHMLGNAADITIRDMAPSSVAYYVEENSPPFENGGIGRYDGFTHCDVGPKRRWTG